jgi:hypothetical protein|tara:strand:+ start:128 stop:277 length:150 start_codon:yes stop_codon:yes gene_type:complete
LLLVNNRFGRQWRGFLHLFSNGKNEGGEQYLWESGSRNIGKTALDISIQ